MYIELRRDRAGAAVRADVSAIRRRSAGVATLAVPSEIQFAPAPAGSVSESGGVERAAGDDDTQPEGRQVDRCAARPPRVPSTRVPLVSVLIEVRVGRARRCAVGVARLESILIQLLLFWSSLRPTWAYWLPWLPVGVQAGRVIFVTAVEVTLAGSGWPMKRSGPCGRGRTEKAPSRQGQAAVGDSRRLGTGRRGRRVAIAPARVDLRAVELVRALAHGSWILTVTDLAVSVLAALSVERYSTTCVPLLDSVTPSAYGVQAPGVPPLVVMRYSVESTPEAPVPVSVAARVTLTERS